MPISLNKEQKIAFIMSPRLGDALLSMVIVNNLKRNGFDVTVFGQYLFALRDWFPAFNIHPFPTAETAKTILSEFAVLLHAYPTDVLANAEQWHRHVVIFDHIPTYRLRIPMPDIQVEICRRELQLTDLVRTNGIEIPKHLIHRKADRRIAMHTTSFAKERSWFPSRFLKLAKQLLRQGYEPAFIVANDERADWQWVEKEGVELPVFSSLSDVAAWLYESGWFIGNDSGIGHLASNLGIPTVSLMMRPGLARRWRPSWAPNVVVLPPAWLITRPMKVRFWKYFVTVRQVLKAFMKLVQGERASTVNQIVENKVNQFI